MLFIHTQAQVCCFTHPYSFYSLLLLQESLPMLSDIFFIGLSLIGGIGLSPILLSFSGANV